LSAFELIPLPLLLQREGVNTSYFQSASLFWHSHHLCEREVRRGELGWVFRLQWNFHTALFWRDGNDFCGREFNSRCNCFP